MWQTNRSFRITVGSVTSAKKTPKQIGGHAIRQVGRPGTIGSPGTIDSPGTGGRAGMTGTAGRQARWAGQAGRPVGRAR